MNDVLDHNREQLAREHQLSLETEPSTPAGGMPRKPGRFLFAPDAVMELLRSRIVGQPHVLQEMEALLRVVKADIGDPERPLSVALLLGPTGVGKTEVVRLLAQAIHGSPDALCRIDMNTLAQEHYAAALTGAPPGYVGSKEGTTLFDAEKIQGSFSRPGIVLFDELEKASPEVIRSLLNVLERGRLTLSAGTRTLDFRNSLIFMTSNLGARDAARYHARFQVGWRRWLRLQPEGEAAIIDSALHCAFDPEFLNRIDRIITYRRIGATELDAVLEIELKRLQERLKRRQCDVMVTGAARHLLCEGHDARFGARHLGRRLRTLLEPALAAAMLAQPDASQFSVDVQDGTLIAQPMAPLR